MTGRDVTSGLTVPTRLLRRTSFGRRTHEIVLQQAGLVHVLRIVTDLLLHDRGGPRGVHGGV